MPNQYSILPNRCIKVAQPVTGYTYIYEIFCILGSRKKSHFHKKVHVKRIIFLKSYHDDDFIVENSHFSS